MSTIDDKIAAKLRHLDELKRTRGKTVQFEKTITLDEDIRRQIIIGGMVAEVFPEVLQFTPQSSEAENEVVFAPLKDFLSLMFGDREHVKRVIKEVNKITRDTTV